MAQGDREWGLWSVHDPRLPPLLRKRSPPPAALWGPIPMGSINFSSVSPSHSHTVLPRQLQHGSLFHRCSPPRTGCSSLEHSPSLQGSPMGLQPLPRHPPAPAWAPPWAADGFLHSPWISMGCRGTLASGTSSAPPFSLTSESTRMFFSHVLTLLFSGCNYNCTITLLSPLLTGPALDRGTSISGATTD